MIKMYTELYRKRDQNLRDPIFLYNKSDIAKEKLYAYIEIGKISNSIEQYAKPSRQPLFEEGIYRIHKRLSKGLKNRSFRYLDILIDSKKYDYEKIPINLNILYPKRHQNKEYKILTVGENINILRKSSYSFVTSKESKRVKGYNLDLEDVYISKGFIYKKSLEEIVKSYDENLFSKYDFPIKLAYLDEKIE